MRNIYVLLALASMTGCAGSDGKDGRAGVDGDDGAVGPAGMNGKDGDEGAPGSKGADGAPGTNGTIGTIGTNGADGSGILQGAGAPAAGLGADGDIYIDTVTRDVYQKSNGTWSVITNLSGGPVGPKGDKGDEGTDGASVRSGAGAPAAGLGNVGDVYIDSATGDLYAKEAGGWTKTGSLQGPAGTDGVDVKDTLQGVRWFAFALSAGNIDAPNLVTSETYTPTSSSASFTFTGAGQHGRLAFATAGSYLPGGVNLSAYESIDLTASVSGGATDNVVLLLTNGEKEGCTWETTAAAGPVYSIDLTTPTNCYPPVNDFSLSSVTDVQVGIVSSGAGASTLTVSDIKFVDSI
jgi:hypothetical protein